MWDLPGKVIEPMSPALAGGFLTTAPPGKSQGLGVLFIYLYKFILLFIFGFIGSSLLCVAFSSCGEQGLLFVAVHGLLLLRRTGSRHAGFSSCGSQALERRLGSVAHGLSCSVACGIFLDQGSNPCPLHWQVDS